MPASSASLPAFTPAALGSESEILVARCLAEIRALTGGEDVRLEPLPPLPAPGERRHAVVLAREELGAVAPARPRAAPVPAPRSRPPVAPPAAPAPELVARALAPTLAVPLPAPSAARAFAAALVASPPEDDVTAVSRRRRRLGRSRLALLACALVAAIAAVLAVARSPLRRRPVVARAVAASVSVGHAAARVASDVIRFGER